MLIIVAIVPCYLQSILLTRVGARYSPDYQVLTNVQYLGNVTLASYTSSHK